MTAAAGRGPLAWVGVTMSLAAAALAGWFLPRTLIDWQPGLALVEPWRAVTAVGVHYSAAHLAGNLAGAVLVGAIGAVARVPARLAVAWLVAWPLTQLALLSRPALQHYGGLSGVLHAGMAIAVVWLIASASTKAQRGLGVAVAIGLLAKVLNEAPWGPVLRHSPHWDIAVAPLVHATGVLAGLLTSLVALASLRRRAHAAQPRMRATSAEVE